LGESDISRYAESLGTNHTIAALIASFIFTALTLILLEMADVTNVLMQATLLVLMVAFVSAMLGLSIIDMRIQLLRGPVPEGRTPSTPGWKFYNVLVLSSILFMGISIVLMMFSRGLTYVGLMSATIVVSTFAVYILCISPYRLKRGQNK
jgi:drug/metabolite transporter (DMT)-like permease